jgi:hypothetical protein
MRINYVLIDYENVPVKSLSLLKDERFHVRIFLGPNNTKLPVEIVLEMQSFKERADYIAIDTSGANALDFHIAYYLGTLASTNPEGFFHIISKDTGFDPLIRHLKQKKVFVARSPSIEEMPCFRVPPAPVSEPSVTFKETSQDREALIQRAIQALVRRKSGKPKNPKALFNTIHTDCGKTLPESEIQFVYETLIKRGYVNLHEGEITYALSLNSMQ